MKTTVNENDVFNKEDVLRLFETKSDNTIKLMKKSSLVKIYRLVFDKPCNHLTKQEIVYLLRREYSKEAYRTGKYADIKVFSL